jgi:hypothetical protein
MNSPDIGNIGDTKTRDEDKQTKLTTTQKTK